MNGPRFKHMVCTHENLPIFKLILLLCKFALHLFELHGILLNRLRLLINLLLQRPGDLHHLLIVLIDPVTSSIDIFL